MVPWQNRPGEIANLLNPAFCAEVLRRCVYRYQQTAGQAFPYVLLFLILPVILHRETRTRMNPRQRLTLHAWLQSNQDLKIGFAQRASILLPHTKEAIIFLLQIGVLKFDEYAAVSLIMNKSTDSPEQDREEIADCFRKAEMLGRWFARAGTPTTIYIMWGVRP